MEFFKLSGAGNDFVAFDNRDGHLPPEPARGPWFRRLCARGEGVGADGVLILETPAEADVRMRYHNADGGEAPMCGNGLRSLARLAHHLGVAGPQMTVLTGAGLHRAVIIDDSRVRVSITDPAEIAPDLPMELDGQVLHAVRANPGVPHVALDVGAWSTPLEELDVDGLGRRLRHHSAVMPAGANINFARPNPDGTVDLRTYERGVEAETLACGTGAVCTAVAANLLRGFPSPVAVRTRGGHTLTVHFRRRGEAFTDVFLEGPAVITYRGHLAPPLLP